MAKKVGEPPELQDRDGSWPPEHDVDSGKALTAFRETMADRQRMTLEGEGMERSAARHAREPDAKIADDGPELDSERVAEEFQTLTRAPQTHVLENKPALERLRLHRRKPGRLKR